VVFVAIKEELMSPVHNYKRLEALAVHTFGKKLRSLFITVRQALRNLHHTGKQRFTVMFIPHSEKKIFNFQVSIYSLSFFLMLIVMIVVVIFFLSTQMTYTEVQAAMDRDQMAQDKEFKNEYRETMFDVVRSTEDFRELMGNLLLLTNPELASRYFDTSAGGNLPLPGESASISESTRELNDLKKLVLLFKNAEIPLKAIMGRVREQNKVFMDIPTAWPLKERGYLTFGFGPQIHPIQGYWYIHKGIDIVYTRGADIVATASGKVLRVQLDPLGYGNYIIISHKYGFSTLYGHLDAVYVQKGQEVERGVVIGALGATGFVTGAHLHYEVRLGNQTVDPILFLDMENSGRSEILK
jgi:murein DD-endopeptidase MepM/ murein hydrolase activator NlpD